jgi:amino-acid N-acetyltransferase
MNATSGQLPVQIQIRDARPEDWAEVTALLTEVGLVPLDDTAQFGPQYAVAEGPDGSVIGVAGYERYGTNILLRSVAVSEPHRRAGLGARLTADRLSHARREGCTVAYLLTDTARGYWERHHFSVIARAAAPADITRSVEWSHACPASAIAMQRDLDQR